MEFFLSADLPLPFSAQIFLVAIFGLIFGSFASLLSHRLATKEPIIFSHSKCPKCQSILKIKNLIPLFSWIFQRGKCSKCHHKISIRYPLIELSVVFAFIIIFLVTQKIDQRFVLLCLISFTLIVMSVTDLEHYFIANSTQYLLAIFVILLRIHDGGTYGAVNNISSAFYYLGFSLFMLFFFYITTKIEAIGVDDVKFFFICGLALGMNNFLFFMLLCGTFGALFGSIWQKIKHDKNFPFAPALCLALFICLLCDNKINPVEIFGSLFF